MESFSLLLKRPKGVTIVSPTQLKMWRDCQRSWGFRYIDGIKTTSPSQALGLSVHDQLENYLRFGTPPNESLMLETSKGPRYPGRIAAAGLPLLPKPGTCLVEKQFCVRFEDVYFFGLIDCWQGQRVIDHKTCVSFRYQLTPEELLNDEQGVIYSVVPFLGGAIDPPVCAWHYYRTSGSPEVRVTEAQVDIPTQLEKLRDIFVPRAREILEARNTVRSAKELPPSPGHCQAYGGCPHLERCGLAPRERLFGAMGFDMDALGDFVDEQQKKLAAAPPPPPAPPPDEPPAAPEDASAQTPPVPQGSEEVPPAPPMEEVPPTGALSADMATWSRAQLKSKALAMGIIDGGCRYGAPRLLKEIQNALNKTKGVLEGDQVYYEPPAPPVPPAPPEEEVPPAPPIAPQEPPLAPQEEDAPPPPVPQVPKDYSVGTLYIDCFPQQGERPEHLSKILRKANEQIVTQSDHYRLETDLEFGKAGAAISLAVAVYLTGQDVYASMRLAEHRDCMALLEGCAVKTIKGG